MNLIEMKVFSEYKHDLMNIMENIWCFWSIWGIFLKGEIYREPATYPTSTLNISTTNKDF